MKLLAIDVLFHCFRRLPSLDETDLSSGPINGILLCRLGGQKLFYGGEQKETF